MQTQKTKKIIASIKRILFISGSILACSLAVGIISYSGYFIADKVPFQWIWIFPLIVGIGIYVALYEIFQKLQHIEHVKSEFLTVAAHNLRTPLTKIQWLITDVADKVADTEAQQRFLDMQLSFKSLTNIINRFLEMSEAGQTSIYFSYLFEEQHIEYIVLQVIANLRLGIERKNIALATRVQQELPPVSIDKERMQLVLNILIENAILYNKKDGSIDIEISQEKDKLVFSITDTGIGIAKEDLPKIFSKFFRAKEAVSVDTDRIGLELALAREIIHKHHGEIHVSSEGYNKGSHFWFTLPIPPKYLT